MSDVTLSAPPLRTPVLYGVAISLGMTVALAIYESANGHEGGFLLTLVEGSRPWTMSILILLTGFVASARMHSRRAFDFDVSQLGPQLACEAEERGRLVSSFQSTGNVQSIVCGLTGVLIGLLVINRGGGGPAIFDGLPLNHHTWSGFGANAVLFWIMGRGFYSSIQNNRLIAALGPVMPPVDLFDLGPYRPFARHGMRGAVLWLGGSSIASLLFIDQRQDTGTGLVIAATVALGIYSLFWPLRGVHRSILRAKSEELARVRGLIRSCRTELLSTIPDSQVSAAQTMPGLLSYEARIVEVREWPMDVPTLVRFALLLTVAIGSWLGGAVVEMLLGTALGD